MTLSKKEWLEERVMCDIYGRAPNLSDVPMTIMTRKDALIKQGGNDKSINELWKSVKEGNDAKKESK